MSDFYEGKMALVTGGAGFIGSELVRQLCQRDAKVTVLDDFSSGDPESLSKLEIELIHGDIRSRKLVKAVMAGQSIIFHLAARPFIPACYHYPTQFLDVNVNGTLNVLLTALETKPELIVYVSSSEVYGTAQYTPMDEEHPTNPHSTYAVSKLAADRLCYTLDKEHGIPIVILRPFNTYGPRETHPYIIPEAISQLARTSSLKLGDIDTSRDFTYVTDIVHGLLLAGERPDLQGEVINLGSGKDIRMRDLVCLIAKLMEKDDVKITTDPAKYRPYDVKQLIADNQKAKRLLKWEPKVPLEEGLNQTIAWYLKNGEKWPWEKRYYPGRSRMR